MSAPLEDISFDDVVVAPVKPTPTAKVNGGHEESFESAKPVTISKEVIDNASHNKVTARRAEPITPTPRAARSLPHSLDAETGLLSTVFVDSGAVLPQAIDAGLTASSFYDPQNGAIFACQVKLHLAHKPVDPAVVAEELKGARAFEGRNLFAKLTEVSSATATTAQSAYFIERVREHALLRDVIRAATTTAEEAYSVTADVGDFISRAEERLRWSEQSQTARSVLERLETARYDPKRRLPDVAAVFFMGETPICTRGNLTTLTAQSKTGKSSFLAGVLASTFKDTDHGGDTFTVRGLNPEGHAVIHFDTEQHGKHHERMMDMVCRRAGADLPPWLCSYARKGASAVQLRAELEAILKSKHRIHHGIHSIHLDGIADFAADVNDPKECNPLVSWLESLSVTYDCPVICVLHLNPVANKDFLAKSRGHLGSQLQRKVETDIRLKKEEDDTTVVFTDPAGTRGAPIFEKDGPRFKWDHEEKMHMTCRAGQSAKDHEKAEALREIAAEAFDFAKSKSMRYGELVRAIEQSAHVSLKRAEARFSEMKKAHVLSKDMMGFWHLADVGE